MVSETHGFGTSTLTDYVESIYLRTAPQAQYGAVNQGY